MRVFTYYNLHKKCWSVRAESGVMKGKVIAHADCVEVEDCTLKVSESGRRRVIKEQKKNVHAGVEGRLMTFIGLPTQAGEKIGLRGNTEGRLSELDDMESLSYNPYVTDTFLAGADKQPIQFAKYVVLTESGAKALPN